MLQRSIIFILVLFVSCFKVSSQGTNCVGADPFCTGTAYNFPAGVNNGTAEIGPNYGCLGSEPNPAWYYLKIATSGDILLNMYGNGGSSSNDIDFICWGPFASTVTPCTAQLTGTCSPCNSDYPHGSYAYPYGNMVDCSYNTSATEQCYIPSGVTGQVYIIMITNYSNDPCNIEFSQTGGSGSTDCSIMSPVVTNNGPLCVGQTLNLTVTNPPSGATYAWTGPNGFTSTLQNPSISNVTLANAGTYSLIVTVGGTSSAPSTTTVVIYPIPTADAGTNQTICAGSSATLTASGGGTYQWNSGASTQSITVTPGSTTPYTVTVTNNGCTASDNATVTVNPLPTANAGLDQTICPGNSATLTATGGGTYAWSTGGNTASISVSPGSTSTYTVTVTSSGCSASDNVIVNVASSIVADAGLPQTICAGQSATLTASGGTTYAWSNGGNTASISVSPASTSTYSVTVSSGGCSGTDNVQVTVNPLPVPDAGSPQTICAGLSATLTASGGGTYQWNTGAGTQSVTVTPGSTTTYTVTVTSSGCTASDNVTVTVNPIPPADAGLPQSVCPGFSATLTASGGGTYQWNTGAGTQAITVTPGATTTYTVTVTSLGCTATDNVTVTVSSGITADAGSPQTICAGQTAVLSAMGGSTFAWNTGDNTQSISVSPASTTTYTVTVSSGSCSGTDDVVVTVNPAATANAGTDQIICAGQSANLTAFGGGTYLWSNASTTQSTNVSPTTSTTYTVTVSSVAGCTDIDDVLVTVNPLPNANAGSDQAICIGNSANLNASGGTSYSWSPTTNLSNPLIANPVANPASSITYNVTVTDANGCTNTDAITLTVNPLPNANAGNDVSICQGSSTTLNASGGSTYAWSPATGLSSTNVNNPSADPASTSTYTVTVSDALGCSQTDDVIVTVNPVPTSDFTLMSPICVAGFSEITYTGTASAGATYNWDFDGGTVLTGSGQGPYQVSWSSASTYNVTLSVTENGCTSSITSNAQVVGQISATIAVSDSISCFGVSDGSATVTPTGTAPFIYQWSNTQSNQIAQNLAANILYTVTVTDNYGCTATQGITLSQPAALSMYFISQNVSCNNGNNGMASAVISGGTTSYQYAWSPSGTAGNVSSVNNLHAGTYTFTATDLHGCSIDTTFSITEPPVLTFSYVVDSVSCNAGNDGAIYLTPSGGNAPYAYTWSPSVSSGQNATSLSAGTYNVTITDHNGCDTSYSIAVEQPLPLVLSTSGNVAICNGQSTTISASASGGTGTYTFTWDNGLGSGASFTVNPTTTTTYTVYVTDENGCTASPQSLTVSVSPPISVQLSATPLAVCYGESVTITATPNGGNGTYSYTWGAGIGVSTSVINIVPDTTTMYTVTVTDACNSPEGMDSVLITVYPLPQVMFDADTISGCEPLGITFTDMTTPAIASWLWNFGDLQSGANNNSTQQNPSHLYDMAGLYDVTLTVTTTDGCSGSLTQQNMIEVYPTPDAFFYSHPEVISILDPNVTFVDLSSDAYTWSWTFGDPVSSDNSSSDPSPTHTYSEPGTYTVTLLITSQNGCMDSVSHDVIVNPEYTFYVPNAFTPDGNGKNDFFHPFGDGFDETTYQLYIYDRWGEMIFETTDFSVYWDGKVNGGTKIAPQGVYTWVIVVKDLAGDTHNYEGRVTLIRK